MATAKIEWPQWETLPWVDRTARNDARRMIRVDVRSVNGTAIGGALAPHGVSYQLVYETDLGHVMVKVPDEDTERLYAQAEALFASDWGDHLAAAQAEYRDSGLSDAAIIDKAHSTRAFSMEAAYGKLARGEFTRVCKRRQDEGKPQPTAMEKARILSGKPIKEFHLHPDRLPAPSTPLTEARDDRNALISALAGAINAGRPQKS